MDVSLFKEALAGVIAPGQKVQYSTRMYISLFPLWQLITILYISHNIIACWTKKSMQ